MIRKGIIIFGILILLTTSLVFAGCEKDKGLYVGFKGVGGDPAPSDFSAYRSDVSEFDINDVTLEFFYGGIFCEDIEYERSQGKNIGKVKLYFRNPALGEFSVINSFSDENLYFIKESEDDYVSEAHRWKGTSYKKGEGEIITIPKELFVVEKGKLYFYVFGKDKNHLYYPNNEYEYISAISIHYKVNGDRVKLSGEVIKE